MSSDEKTEVKTETEVKVVKKVDGKIKSWIKRNWITLVAGVAGAATGGIVTAIALTNGTKIISLPETTDSPEVLATFTHADGTTVDVDLT